jgi:flagellar basal body-associated protein FliL
LTKLPQLIIILLLLLVVVVVVVAAAAAAVTVTAIYKRNVAKQKRHLKGARGHG